MHLIFDCENRIDPIVCRTEAEVRDMVHELGEAPFQVLRIDVDELCRDVTDEFLPDEIEEAPEYPEWDRACSAGDRAYQLAREQF